MRAELVAAFAIGVTALLLAGCGDGGGTKTTGETFATAPSPSSTSSSVSAGSPTHGSTTTAAVTIPAQGPEASLQSFKTPSGNIACYLTTSSVRCEIHDHTFTPPPKPASCDSDWGDAIGLNDRQGATFVCHGDTVFDPSATVLPYGSRTRQGSMVCASAENGVTCINEGSGHGFLISRQSYNLS